MTKKSQTFSRWLCLLLLALCCVPAQGRNERDTLGVGTAVRFVENLGQWDPLVRYEAQLHNAALFLQTDGITIVLRTPLTHPSAGGQKPASSHVYRMRFAGAIPTQPMGLERQNEYHNYFLGDDPSRWRSKVGLFGAVMYVGLWNGIDLEVYGDQRALKYNFIVAPGADPSQIAIEYVGTDGLSVNRNGDLVVRTSVRDVVELHPYVFQRVDGKEREVASHWRVKGETVSIELGDYDPSQELIVDPVLIFSTYTGSRSDNWGTTATYDSHKNAYTSGLVFGVDFDTTTGPHVGATSSQPYVAIFKFDSQGHDLLYATYLGGEKSDMPHSMFVNSFDELIVFGTTGSRHFPTTEGAFQRVHGGGSGFNYEGSDIPYPYGSDIFVSRFSADGTRLMASTYVGGSGNDGLNFRNYYNKYRSDGFYVLMGGNDSLYYNYGDGARGELITDDLNNIYVGSTTMSYDFPTTAGCVQRTNHGLQEGVVFKLDHNMRNLLWSTYLGGSGDDAVYSIDVDSAYNLLVCGGTNSRDFPVTDEAFQPSYGGGTADGFVSKLSYHGDRIMTSTFVGKGMYDQLYFVRTGRHDEVFVYGQTHPSTSTQMIYNAGYSVPNSGMLLMRFKPDLSGRVWSTVFGTPNRINLSPTAFAADICNRIYLVGWGRDFVPYNSNTWSDPTIGTKEMQTTPDALYDTTDGQDFYIMSMDADANDIVYATFFGEMHEGSNVRSGADHVDGGTSRFDRLATLYQSVCGSCSGTQRFPTTDSAWCDVNRGVTPNGYANCNNALFRFSVAEDFPVAEFIPPTVGCAPYSVVFQNTGRGSSFLWDFGDGSATSSLRDPSHTYAAAGQYTVTLIARLENGCSDADTQRHTVYVLGNGFHEYGPDSICNGQSIQIGPRPMLGADYLWTTPGVSDSSVANPWVNASGTYMLRISAQGCHEDDTFTIFALRLVDTVLLTPASCHDFADGRLAIVLNGNLDPDSLNVKIVVGGIVVGSERHGDTLVVNGLRGGARVDYSISGYGCNVDSTLRLANPALSTYQKECRNMLCNDSCTAWIHLWGDFIDTTLRDLCPGSYIVDFADSKGCPLSDTTEVTRSRLLDSLTVSADASEVFLGQSVRLHATLPRPDTSVTFLWEPAAELDNPLSAHPLATPLDTLSCYSVTASSSIGCKVVETVCVQVVNVICGEPDYILPNAFTPNGDGVNDYVEFGSEILSELRVSVFNRWGECVFSGDSPTSCRWDGTYRNTQCLPGVYTYVCHIRCHNGVETDLKGDITLIR